jgi:serine/threonine-protein kinase
VRLVAQLASALDAAHEAGLVHRDVKPANVLVTEADHVYLTDFGLTKRVAADAEATRTGVVLGTLNYMAPEQIRGQTIGPFTDVYSLGCMVVHLLTGQVPFPVETEEAKLWAHVAEPPPRPSERVQGLGTAFDPVVACALGKRPEDRYASAGALGSALAAALQPAPEPPPAPVREAARPQAVAPEPARKASPARVARRDVLRAAAQEPFNMAVLAVLLVAAIALGQVALGVPLALAVYAAAVLRSFFDPDTERRVQRG